MDFEKITFTDHPQNPIIIPPFPDWILADPTVLSPEESPDSTWHLFAHGVFSLYHYTSSNGVTWKKMPGRVTSLGFRPFIFKEDDTFYLIYEKILVPRKYLLPGKFPYYNSHLEVKISKDLVHWSSHHVLVTPDLAWHKSQPSKGNIGNPCLIKVNGKYRLYYSAGLVYLPDCRFCEPRFLGIAEATHILGPYKFFPDPTFSGKDDKYVNISASANRVYDSEKSLRVYAHQEGFLGLQTCIFRDKDTNKSSGIIRLTRSKDGINWEILSGPIISPDKEWKKSHVYVGDLKRVGDEVRIYYNARNGWLWGKEQIGLATAIIPV